MMRLKINHKIVWLIILLQMVLAFLWHYLAQNQAESGQPGGIMPLTLSSTYGYALAFVGAVVMTYCMAYLYSAMQIQKLFSGILLAFLLWLCFHFQEMAVIDVFQQQEQTMLLLNSSKSLLNFILAGSLLSGLPKYKEPSLLKGYGYPGD